MVAVPHVDDWFESARRFCRMLPGIVGLKEDCVLGAAVQWRDRLLAVYLWI
jgi:hypothetical protein